MKVLIYALGGGRGHVQRQLALGSRLVKLGAERVTLLSSSEWCSRGNEFFKNYQLEDDDVIRNQIAGVEVIVIPSTWSANDLTQFLIKLIFRHIWDWFVVDVFPRGILGELEGVLSGGKHRFKTAIVQRIFNTSYLRFLNDYCTWPVYDVSFVPGENSGLNRLSKISIHTHPWIFRSFDELVSPQPFKDLSKSDTGRSKRLLLVASGTFEESGFWRNLYTYMSGAPLLADWQIDFAGSQTDDFHSGSWPLMDRIPMYDLVVGGGGYNLVHECRLLKIPLVTWPLKRKYDDQNARVTQHNIPKVNSRTGLVDFICKFDDFRKDSVETAYENGADTAAEFLLNQQAAK